MSFGVTRSTTEMIRNVSVPSFFSQFAHELEIGDYKAALNRLKGGEIGFTDIDTNGNTILHHFCKSKIACSPSSLDQRDALLKEILDTCPPADIFKKNRDGKSPFILAVENADIDLLTVFVEHLQKTGILNNEIIASLENEIDRTIKAKKFSGSILHALGIIFDILGGYKDITVTAFHKLASQIPHKGEEDKYYNQLDAEFFGKTAEEIFRKDRNKKSCLDVAIDSSNIYATRQFVLLLQTYSTDVLQKLKIQKTMERVLDFIGRKVDEKHVVDLRDIETICKLIQNQINTTAVQPKSAIAITGLRPQPSPIPATFDKEQKAKAAIGEAALKLITCNGEGTSGFQKMVFSQDFKGLEDIIPQFKLLPESLRSGLPIDIWMRILREYKGEVTQSKRAEQLAIEISSLADKTVSSGHRKKSDQDTYLLSQRHEHNKCCLATLESSEDFSINLFITAIKRSSPILTLEDKLHLLIQVLKKELTDESIKSILTIFELPSYLLFYADKQTGTTVWQIAVSSKNLYLIDYLVDTLEKNPTKYVPWLSYIKQLANIIHPVDTSVSNPLRPLLERLEKTSIPFLIENGQFSIAFSYVLKHNINLESEFLDKSTLLHHIASKFNASDDSKARLNLITHLIKLTANSRHLFKTNRSGKTALDIAFEMSDFETARLLIKRMQEYGVPKEHKIGDLISLVSSIQLSSKNKVLWEINDILQELNKRALSYYESYSLLDLAVVDLSQYPQEAVLKLYERKIATCKIADKETSPVLYSEDGTPIQEVAEEAGNLFLKNFISQYLVAQSHEKPRKDSRKLYLENAKVQLPAMEASAKPLRTQERVSKKPVPVSAAHSPDDTYTIHALIVDPTFNSEKFKAALFGKAAKALFSEDSNGKTPLQLCLERDNFRAAAILIDDLSTFLPKDLQSVPLQKHAELASDMLHKVVAHINSAESCGIPSYYTQDNLKCLEKITLDLTLLSSKITATPTLREVVVPATEKLRKPENPIHTATKYSDALKEKLFALFNKKHSPKIDIEAECANLAENISVLDLFQPDTDGNTLLDYSITNLNERACMFLQEKLRTASDITKQKIPLQKYISKIAEVLEYETPELTEQLWLQNLCDKIEEIIDPTDDLAEDFENIAL